MVSSILTSFSSFFTKTESNSNSKIDRVLETVAKHIETNAFIVDTNIKTKSNSLLSLIKKAKVFLLAEKHENEAHNAINKIIIENLWTKSSIYLFESKPNNNPNFLQLLCDHEQLDSNKITSLQSWDTSTGFSKEYDAIYSKDATLLLWAEALEPFIGSLLDFHTTSKEDLQNDIKECTKQINEYTVCDLAFKSFKRAFSYFLIYFNLEKKGGFQKKMAIEKLINVLNKWIDCSNKLDEEIWNFCCESFNNRQNALVKSVEKACKEYDRVFLKAGQGHLFKIDPDTGNMIADPIVQDYLKKKNISYLILCPKEEESMGDLKTSEKNESNNDLDIKEIFQMYLELNLRDQEKMPTLTEGMGIRENYLILFQEFRDVLLKKIEA